MTVPARQLESCGVEGTTVEPAAAAAAVGRGEEEEDGWLVGWREPRGV